MTFSIFEKIQAKIWVVGVGRAGGHAINRMIESGLQGVEFIAIDTDEQDLELLQAPHCIQIGRNITKGLGAGANPEIGAEAIEQVPQTIFLRVPKPEDIELTPQEKQALKNFLDWEKRSAKTHWILGQPVGR